MDNINHIDVNNIKQEDYYSITKLNQEAKHRSLSHLNIIDIRLYSYFSRFADLNDKYLINEIITAIKNDQILIVDPDDFLRDYIHPDDLFNFICQPEYILPENHSYTLGSKQPISKASILNFFKEKYSLKFEIREITDHLSATGQKTNYVPARIDNIPQYTSLQTIEMEAKYLLL
jgi:nucleoside-diphosphate-sugar epimerase